MARGPRRAGADAPATSRLTDVVRRPHTFKTHRALYYDLLNGVREHGDWERWLEFFAEGIEVTAAQGVRTANDLLALVNADRARIAALGRAAASALEVHGALQRQPIATSGSLVKATGLTPATVNKSLAHLERLGVVGEITNRQRGRVFSYGEYVTTLAAELESPDSKAPRALATQRSPYRPR